MAVFRRVGVLCAGLGVGVGLPLYASHRDVPILSSSENIFCAKPLRVLSSVSDALHATKLPVSLRSPVLGAYCALLAVPKAERGDLSSYETLLEFRKRALACHSIASDALVSPVDGVVLAAGAAGPYGSLTLGPGCAARARDLLNAGARDPLCGRAVAVGGETEAASATLRFAVIAPEPSDPHSMISPADWEVVSKRSINGGLLGVSKPGECAFGANERVVYEGHWEHGLLAVVAVAGAGRRPKLGDHDGKLRKGGGLDYVGMTAAIVLVFEAPDHGFAFAVHPGERVRRGQKVINFENGASVQLSGEDAAALARLAEKKSTRSAGTVRARQTW